METEVNLPFITSVDGNPSHLVKKLTRAELEKMTSDLIDKSMKSVKEVLKDAGFEPKDIEEIVLVGGMTRMPKIQEEIKKLFNKEPNREINPDEVVAIGAATQGGILQGDVKDVLLLDVTPLSLGIETMGQVNTVQITKNTTIPANKTQTFSTAADNQPSVEIKVLQGERPMSHDNKTLGKFILDGIPPSPRGVPQIEVSFDIDANGILNVSAKDKATGKSQSIRIEGSSGLSDEEIEKITKDAEKHAEDDKKKKELIEAQNLAESLIHATEKTIKEGGDKIAKEKKEEIEKKVDELKKVKDSDKIEDIKKKSDELSEAIQKVGADMYKQAQEAEAKKAKPKEGEQASADDKPKAEEGEYKEKEEPKQEEQQKPEDR